MTIALRQDARVSSLTVAEIAVLRALVRGESNASVAHERGTSVRTVANQVRRLFRKLGVSSRAEVALELGAVDLGADFEWGPSALFDVGHCDGESERASVDTVLDGGLCFVGEARRGAEHRALFERLDAPHALSPRQVTVLRSQLAGTPIKAIARDLAVSEATVWAELAVLEERLGFSDRLQLLRILAPLARSDGAAPRLRLLTP
jgi:DNA-binding NarL/FixJ family response regulator